MKFSENFNDKIIAFGYRFLTVFFNICCLYFIQAQEIPILAFHGVQRDNLSVENFSKMKQAGIKINFSIYKSNEEAQKALDNAECAGVKILLYSDDLVHYPEQTIKRCRSVLLMMRHYF